jgi:iron complex outermembrane receptor protein
VAGAVVMKPRISGQLVDLGLIGSRPAGIPSTVGFVSFDQRIAQVPGLSIDGRLNFETSRPANSLNTLETDGVALVDLGGRYSFKLGKTPVVFRATVANLLNYRGWVAGGGGTMNAVTGRMVRTSLMFQFGP